MTSDLWPLFDLRIETPRLVLRLPTDAEIAVAAKAVKATGIHGEVIPFVQDWSSIPEPEFSPQFAQFHWKEKGAWKPVAWHLVLFAFLDDEPVGCQSMEAENFASVRSVATGSWLLKSHQGMGLGKEMRAGILELAFDGLAAEEALSESRVGNKGSGGVSQSLGYERNGMKRTSFGDQVDEEDRWRLTANRWETHETGIEVSVAGLDTCRHMFGVKP